jgi:hypothetical protein
LKDGSGKSLKELQNNDALLSKLNADNIATREFITIPNEAGDQMNAYIINLKTLTQIKNIHYLCINILGQVLNLFQILGTEETDFGSIIWCKKGIL